MNSLLFKDLQVNRVDPTHVQIERMLRDLIRTGQLSPGDRVPSAEELAACMMVHPTTVQKALRRLKTTGLITRTPHLGTFVNKQQETMTSVLAFGPSLTDESAHFYRALLRSLRTALAGLNWQGRIYDNLNVSMAATGSPAIQRLMLDRQYGDFNGLIAVALGSGVSSELRAACHPAPSVVCGMDEEVDFDFRDFTAASLSFLALRGCTRIVYLRTLPDWTNPKTDIEALLDAARRHGIAHAEVIQLPERPARYSEEADRLFCESLMRQWTAADAWPDGIIVSDDVTMRGLAHALIACGPERLARVSVVTWANEGVDFGYGMPVVRYVVSPPEIARQLTALLQKRIQGYAKGQAEIRVRGTICPAGSTAGP